jgi:sarcosine oxidase subunit beta
MNLRRSAETVIVGGGVMGCGLAYQLQRRGHDVVLLERDTLGSHSTGRSAGGVRKQFSNAVNVKLQLLTECLLDDFEAEVGVSPDFRRIGYLFVLADEDDAAQFKGLLSMWHTLGVRDAEWVSPEAIAELAPAVRVDDVLGGTFCPSDGIASPSDVTYGYSSAAKRHGARIYEHCRVTDIDVAHGRVETVVTEHGAIDCRNVVVCAGAWAAEVAGLAGAELPVSPHRRHMFYTGPVEGVQASSPMTVDFSTSLYFHPEGPGVLLGMSDTDDSPSFDTQTDWSFLERIFDVAEWRVPSLTRAEIRSGWAGLYEITPDHQPVLGPIEDVAGLWAAAGFSGHGFMQAPAAALLLTQLMLDGRSEIDIRPFAHSRFSGSPLTPELNIV